MSEFCKNCGTEFNGNFCSNCGQPAKLKRIDAHYIKHEIEHVLHYDKGILFTVKELLLRPGKNVREFFTENRNRLVKPIIFIIVTSLIYSLISHFFHIEEEYVSFDGLENSAIGKILKWIQSHYGYANILMGVFIALFIKLVTFSCLHTTVRLGAVFRDQTDLIISMFMHSILLYKQYFIHRFRSF